MSRPLALALASLLVVSGCKKDEAKQAAPKPQATPEAIPNDIVYNSFFASPSATAALKVAFDGGLEAGTLGTADPAASGGGGGRSNVVEAGAEPRAKLAYAYSLNKSASVTSTLTMSLEGNVPPGTGGAQPPVRFSYVVTPKSRTPEGKTHFEVKLQKAELIAEGGRPEIAQQKAMFERGMSGLEASFEATANGDVSDTHVSSERIPRMAQQVIPLFLQSLEFLIVPVPSAPVGVGAKWTVATRDEGSGSVVTSSYTLLARDASTIEVKVENLLSSPKRAVEEEGAPPGTVSEETGAGSFTIVARLDGVATKAEGATTSGRTVTIPGRGSQSVSVKQAQSLVSH